MTPAYSELYLGDASLALGSMLESSVYLFGIDLDVFWQLFLSSHVSDDFGHGLSGTVSGKSGWELAVEILEDAKIEFRHEKPKGVVGRSLHTILLMYSPYHEMDVTQLFEALDGLRALPQQAGCGRIREEGKRR